MQLQKQEIIQWLVDHGDEAKAWDIENKVPEVLDTEQDRELLATHGIDVDAIESR